MGCERISFLKFTSAHKGSPKLFVAIVLLLGYGVFLVVGAVNYLVDPYRLSGAKEISGWTNEKTEIPKSGMRRAKALAIEREKFDTLILGSSRAEIGIDPKQTAFAGSVVYNAALSGANFYEIREVFNFAIEHQKLKRAFIGLDFFGFSDRRTVTLDFAQSDFNRGAGVGIENWLRYFLSKDILLESLRTVRANYLGKKEPYTVEGMNLHFEQMHEVDQRKLFIDVLRTNFFINPENYAGFRYSTERLAALRDVIAICEGRGIKLYLFISPIHARQLEALVAMGLYPAFERWKRDLTFAVDEVNRFHPETPHTMLWDFSGYNVYTTETVPPVGVKGRRMKWYWESSHYTKELGNIVIKTVLSRKRPNGFGLVLTPGNIEGVLADARIGRENYVKNAPDEVSEVIRLAAETRNVWGRYLN